jgi:hypothetical protein
VRYNTKPKRKVFEASGKESVGAMNTYGVNDHYGVDELQATGSALIKAYEGGHELGEWHPIEERMRVAGCRRCGRLVWIIRPPEEKTWRVGGNALTAACVQG